MPCWEHQRLSRRTLSSSQLTFSTGMSSRWFCGCPPHFQRSPTKPQASIFAFTPLHCWCCVFFASRNWSHPMVHLAIPTVMHIVVTNGCNHVGLWRHHRNWPTCEEYGLFLSLYPHIHAHFVAVDEKNQTNRKSLYPPLHDHQPRSYLGNWMAGDFDEYAYPSMHTGTGTRVPGTGTGYAYQYPGCPDDNLQVY